MFICLKLQLFLQIQPLKLKDKLIPVVLSEPQTFQTTEWFWY